MSEIEAARLDLKTSVSLLQLEKGAHEAYRSKRTVEAIEALIDTKLAEHADRIRAIAREEIEANEERLMHKAMHGEIERGRECDEAGALTPAVEAPAAGNCPHCDGTGLFRGGRAAVQVPKCPRCYGSGKAEDVGPRNAVEAAAGDPKEMAGRLRNIARDPNNFIPRAGSLIEAAVMIEDTTAIARRLAEALNKVWLSGEPEAHEREVESALTEARKRGLIE